MIKEFTTEYRSQKDKQNKDKRQKIFKTIFDNKISGNLFTKTKLFSND